jgi:hypothetical protein
MVRSVIEKSYGISESADALLTKLANNEALNNFTENMPYEAYQNNSVSNYITNAFDVSLKADMRAIYEMIDNLSFKSTSDKWLDYLALLVGYVNYGFWSSKFSVVQKQRLIKYAMQIWERLGSAYSLITVLNCLDIPYRDYWESIGAFIATEFIDDEYGGVVAASQDDVNGTVLQRQTPFEGFVRMNISVMRWLPVWQLTLQIVRYFSPAVTTIDVVYEEFSADLSLAGEPVFS